MATAQHNKNVDFRWSGSELFMAIFLGTVVVGGLWLFSGLLMMLFLM